MNIVNAIDNGETQLNVFAGQCEDALSVLSSVDFSDWDETSIDAIVQDSTSVIEKFYDVFGFDYPFGSVNEDEIVPFDYSEDPEVLAENAMNFFEGYRRYFTSVQAQLEDGMSYLAGLDARQTPMQWLRIFVEDFQSTVVRNLPSCFNEWTFRLQVHMLHAE